MPGTQTDPSQKSSKAATEPHSSDVQDTRTLIEAMNLSLRYGTEYMNELPLVGEPGTFHLSKTRDALAAPPPPPSANASQATQPLSSRQASEAAASKKPTPAPSPPAPPPPIQTDVPPAASRKSAKGTPATPGSSTKPKRRKSKAANKFEEGTA